MPSTPTPTPTPSFPFTSAFVFIPSSIRSIFSSSPNNAFFSFTPHIKLPRSFIHAAFLKRHISPVLPAPSIPQAASTFPSSSSPSSSSGASVSALQQDASFTISDEPGLSIAPIHAIRLGNLVWTHPKIEKDKMAPTNGAMQQIEKVVPRVALQRRDKDRISLSFDMGIAGNKDAGHEYSRSRVFQVVLPPQVRNAPQAATLLVTFLEIYAALSTSVTTGTKGSVSLLQKLQNATEKLVVVVLDSKCSYTTRLLLDYLTIVDTNHLLDIHVFAPRPKATDFTSHAVTVHDASKISFSEHLHDIHFVIDTLGTEDNVYDTTVSVSVQALDPRSGPTVLDSKARSIRRPIQTPALSLLRAKFPQVEYVSVAPLWLYEMRDKGLGAMVSSMISFPWQKKKNQDTDVDANADTPAKDNPTGPVSVLLEQTVVQAFSDCVAWIENQAQGKLMITNVLSKEQNKMQALMQTTAWPRDLDSGFRYGFPSSEDLQDGDQDNGSEQEQEQESELGQPSSQAPTTTNNNATPTTTTTTPIDGIYYLSTPQQALQLATQDFSDRPVLLLLTAAWCRKCKYVKTQLKKLAPQLAHNNNIVVAILETSLLPGEKEKQQQQGEWNDTDGRIAPDELVTFFDVENVPEFVVFRYGKKIDDVHISTASRAEMADSIARWA